MSTGEISPLALRIVSSIRSVILQLGTKPKQCIPEIRKKFPYFRYSHLEEHLDTLDIPQGARGGGGH